MLKPTPDRGYAAKFQACYTLMRSVFQAGVLDFTQDRTFKVFEIEVLLARTKKPSALILPSDIVFAFLPYGLRHAGASRPIELWNLLQEAGFFRLLPYVHEGQSGPAPQETLPVERKPQYCHLNRLDAERPTCDQFQIRPVSKTVAKQ